MKIWVIVISVFFCLVASSASAHTRSQSFSNWQIEGNEAQFVFAVSAERITQLGPLYPGETELHSLLLEHLRETIHVEQSGRRCTLEALEPLGDGRETYRVHGVFRCPDSAENAPMGSIVSAFFKVSPTHIHIARLDGGNDQVLRQGYERFTLDVHETPQSIAGFVRAGFNHVLSGADHLLFLVLLAFVARRPRQAILCVTGFTVGHTLSLGLASYGLISPHANIVEALIGFTIAIMALEVGAFHGLSRRKALSAFGMLSFLVVALPVGIGSAPLSLGILLAVFAVASGGLTREAAQKILPVMTIAFGLIHGAGFAGGLQEFQLSPTDILIPLLGFNIGVELAQLLALCAVYFVMWGINFSNAQKLVPIETSLSVLIFGLGCFWFASRVWV